MITPIMSNGIIAQTQNVSAINHGDENRNQISYQATQTTVEVKSEEAHTTVIASQESDSTDTRHDAREEGKNKYSNNRGNAKKKNNPPSEGVVVKKKVGGFDISV